MSTCIYNRAVGAGPADAAVAGPKIAPDARRGKLASRG